MRPSPVEPPRDGIALRREIITACLRMQELGFFVGTWGNVAARVREGMLVTPTRMNYDRMRPADLVLVDWDGRQLSGKRLPSSEMHLHRLLLKDRPDIGTTVHNHSPWATAAACAGESIPVIVEDMAQIIGSAVACCPHVPAGHHVELAKAAAKAMCKDSWAVLIANHGVVVGGRTVAEAVVASQVMEKAAMAYMLGRALGSVRPIRRRWARQERERYLFKYGTSKDVAEDKP